MAPPPVPLLPSPRRALSRLLPRLLPFLPFACALVVLKRALDPIDGLLGHDYYYELSRLQIGALHFWQNGLDIPHYTARMCAGMPFFANPQSTYYSLPQFLTFVMDPVLAAQTTILVFTALGYLGCLRLFTRIFDTSENVAHLGAMLFALNGFAFAHLFVGHLTHHTYMLMPWLIERLLQRPGPAGFLPAARRVAWFTLILAYIFYSGGLHMLVVFAVLFVLLLPYLLHRMRDRAELRAFAVFLLASGACFAAACCGKLVASYLYSALFYVRDLDLFSGTTLELVTRYFWFTPSETPLALQFVDFSVGPWEYVGWVSKAVLPLMVLAAMRVPARADRRTLAMAAAYVVLVPFVAFVALGTGMNRSLPFFRHYHNPIKILAAFIPPFVMMAAVALRGLSKLPFVTRLPTPARTAGTLLLGFALLAEYSVYTDFFVSNKIGIEFPYDASLYRRLKDEKLRPVVSEVIAAGGADVGGVIAGATSTMCYEPVFGYQHETLATTAVPGRAADVRLDRFNLNHPGCLVYPSHFGCQPWDRIPASDRKNFDLFVRGYTTRWGVPPWQQALYAFNVVVLLLLLAVALFPGGQKRRSLQA